MFEKYIMIKENKIIVGQTSSGYWYCKELPVDSTQELDLVINEINRILNKYNTDNKKFGKEKKSKESGGVKGLD